MFVDGQLLAFMALSYSRAKSLQTVSYGNSAVVFYDLRTASMCVPFSLLGASVSGNCRDVSAQDMAQYGPLFTALDSALPRSV